MRGRQCLQRKEATMRNSSKKTPWHLRFGENWKTAAAAVVVGIALLASPSEEVQAQCEVQILCYDNLEFGDATSKANCDRILQEGLDKIKDKGVEIRNKWKAAKYCDTRYADDLKMNNLRHQGALISAELQGRQYFV